MEEKLFAEAQMVARGVRPAALAAVKEQQVEMAREVAEEVGVLAHVEDLGEGWMSVWYYRDPHIAEVIRELPEAPAGVFDHWVLGKLFGYSEEAIASFLQSRELLPNSEVGSSVALWARG